MPGLPKNLLSTYQKYKNHTDSIAQWLAFTAKSRGYVSPKTKGSKKTPKIPQGRPTYTIPAKEWVPMAEFISGLLDPPVHVPQKLANLLDATIRLRQTYSEHINDILADTADKDSNDRHAFFLDILKNVRSVLSSRLPATPANIKKSETAVEVFNMFERLDLEEPSEAFEIAPDAAPKNEPIYKAERPNDDLEEDFFMLHLLLHDLHKLRIEVSHAWEGHKEGGYDLVAASITTNTAVDIARSLVDDAKPTFNKHGGALRMLQIYYASQRLAAGITKLDKERPGDDINFAMYETADSLMWPALTLLDAFTRMHKVNPRPEMKPGFYGTYNPASCRDKKDARDKFLEDKILLLEMLPEFCFHCLATKSASLPVEDELTRELRAMFETKEVTLPLVFATTLFLDIHHILRAEVDYGFARLTKAAQFIVDDIKSEIEFHKGISMETWPTQNDDVMQHFIHTVEFWILNDQQQKFAPQLHRINIPGSFLLFRKHPWSCGLWKYWAQMQFHEFSVVYVNAWGSVMSCAHLYNAVQGGATQTMMWKDLDVVVGLQDPKTVFIGDPPSSSDDCLKRFALVMGASAANLAKSTRKKRGLTLSKRGPKGLKELGPTLQTFRSRICEANGPKTIRAEDVENILEKANWDYELDDNERARTVYKDIGEAPKKTAAKKLSVAACLGLVRDLLHAEMLEVAFDYLRLHRQCWRLLRNVKEACRDDLIRMFGPNYIEKESQLPFVVGYVLLTASNSQRLGEMLRPKQSGVEVTSKVLNVAKAVVKGMIESGAGALIVDLILPEALDLQVDFEVEVES